MNESPLIIEIDSLGSSGEGIGSFEGYKFFVENALPQEKVKILPLIRKKNYGTAKLLEVLSPSLDRKDPICPHFSSCGGCQLMHLSYEKQLEFKRQKVIDALRKIGNIQDAEVSTCHPSPQKLNYRNKIQLPARIEDRKISFGLYEKKSHHLIPIDECKIHCSIGEKIYQKIIAKIPINLPIRHLLIKSSSFSQKSLIIFVSKEKPNQDWIDFGKKLISTFPEIAGVIHNLHDTTENVILGRTFYPLAGVDFLEEKLYDLTFQISSASFFQVNPRQAEILYQRAVQLADLKGYETVLDAYCGVGTLSLFFARHVKKVIGVESVSFAVKNAKKNSQLNQISNCSFFCSFAERFIQSLEEKIDLLLINPPRKGCEESFLQKIKDLGPKKIIYISCDPATLARDLKIIRSFDYEISRVEPLDMFPQTAHVETIVLLEKKPT